MPSAVTGLDETQPGLVTSAHLLDSQGLIHLYGFYSTTDLPNGAVAGYRSTHSVQQGEFGTPKLQETVKYTSRVSSVRTVYPIASRTVYRNDDGTGAMVSSNTYTWHGSTAQVLERTTTYPIVPTSQNRSNVATSMKTQFDIFGRGIWSMDEDGFIHATEYDTLTSAVTKKIRDVNTTTA